MSTMSTVGILISVVVYLVGMLAIGIVYSKNNNSEDSIWADASWAP